MLICFTTTLAAEDGGGKELIMAMNNVSNMNLQSVMGSSYYFYFKACFFAGLFRRAIIQSLSAA